MVDKVCLDIVVKNEDQIKLFDNVKKYAKDEGVDIDIFVGK